MTTTTGQAGWYDHDPMTRTSRNTRPPSTRESRPVASGPNSVLGKPYPDTLHVPAPHTPPARRRGRRRTSFEHPTRDSSSMFHP